MKLTCRMLLPFAAVTLVLSACAEDSADSNGSAASDQASSSETTASTDEPSTTGPTATADQTTTDASTSSASTATSAAETTASSDPDTTTTEAGEECSASGVERPGPQAELPTAVAERREAILTAALECDIEALAALTGPSFTASFGGDAPLDLWTTLEELGEEPLRALVEILRLEPTLSEDFYVWPPAFLYQTWEDVPEADREALRVLYDDEDFEGFASFGSYIGYRTSIDEDGTWTVFVAGD